MEKFCIIGLLLIWLTFFAINQNVQEDFNRIKLDDYWHQLKNDSRVLWGVVIIWAGKQEYERYIGFSPNKFITYINKLTILKVDSKRVLEITFGHKIVDFIRKDIYTIFDSNPNCYTKRCYHQ